MRPNIVKTIGVLGVCMAFLCIATGQQALAQDQSSGAVLPLKKTIAVADFENKAGYVSKYDVGEGMAEMLTDALLQSGRFIVIERGALDSVLAEQNLGASSRAAKGAAASKGKIGRAQILVEGVISEFATTSSGGGQSFNIKGFEFGSDSAEAHVAVIIRLIDSSTSEVLASKRVEGKAKRGGTAFGFTESKWGFSQSGEEAMPIDKAVQIAIDNAVNYISSEMSRVQWKGKIIKVNDAGISFINAGQNANVQSGMVFMTFRPGEELIDPDTGMNLGSDESFVGRLRVTDVKEKFCKAQAIDDAQPATGDIVKGTN